MFYVDSDSRTRKPFGRVFYTRGKSLAFYAFDLDHQPGVRTAAAFVGMAMQLFPVLSLTPPGLLAKRHAHPRRKSCRVTRTLLHKIAFGSYTLRHLPYGYWRRA